MSTSHLLNDHLDESEDEEDFNPQAHVSDDEDAGGSDNDEDAGAQIRNEAAAQVEEQEDDEDVESEGEDTAPKANDDDDEDDEEEEDEEDEEITVSSFLLLPGIIALDWALIEESGPSEKAQTGTPQSVPRCRSRSR